MLNYQRVSQFRNSDSEEIRSINNLIPWFIWWIWYLNINHGIHCRCLGLFHTRFSHQPWPKIGAKKPATRDSMGSSSLPWLWPHRRGGCPIWEGNIWRFPEGIPQIIHFHAGFSMKLNHPAIGWYWMLLGYPHDFGLPCFLLLPLEDLNSWELPTGNWNPIFH